LTDYREIVLMDFSECDSGSKNEPVFRQIQKFEESVNLVKEQPDFTVFDENQEFGIVASSKDAFWFKLGDQEQHGIDLDK
jgi:hypothetical protein